MSESALQTGDARSAPPDAEARRRAVGSEGCVLVQAPAGSGKTTLLAQRYLRLLARVEAPESILALTFTRRAAQEMRERILAALGAAALAQCPPTLPRDTWELALAARRHLAAHGIDLERHPARLRIETIDAFNAWLAVQLPVTAGAAMGREVREDAAALHLEAARRTLAEQGTPDHAAAVERVLALDDQRWRALVELIAGMLASRDRWLPLLAGRLGAASRLCASELEVVRRHLDEDLGLLVTRVLRDAHEALGEERVADLARALATAARHSGAAELEAFAHDDRPLAPRAAELERWRALARVCLTREGGVRRRVHRGQGFAPGTHAQRTMRDALEELAREPWAVRALQRVSELPDAVYRDEDWERVRDVSQVLVLAAAQLDQVFAEQGAVDFAAVSMAALRALGPSDSPTDLALRLDYRLEHILVDEFQDTSSAQLELLERLTAGWQAGDGRSIFCVGDPMQSIYGFRQAEVRAFLDLARNGLGGLAFAVERLSGNFRAADTLIEWVNSAFARIMPARDDRERGAIAFRPSVAARAVSGAEPAVALRAFPSVSAEAEAIAAAIEGRRTAQPDWRIAVLVRARPHARAIARALRRRGVAFEAVEVEPIIERPCVRDALTLARALLHPGDRIAWLGLLRSPLVGLELADLLVIARADGIVLDALAAPAVRERLSANARARVGRLSSLIEAALAARGRQRVARWVESVWLALGGAAGAGEDLEHVRLVFEHLQTLEERGLPDAADLEACFAELSAESRRADDRSGGGRIEIMTIHKAKGLEFDCVIVPALDRQTRSSGAELLLAHSFARAERDGLVLAARPPIGAADAPLFEFLRTAGREAAALEAQRLLYVACTRAKHELLLSATTARAPEEEGSETEEDMRERRPFRPHAGSLLAVLWPVAGAEFLARGAMPFARSASAAPPPEPPSQASTRLPLGWSPPPLGAARLAAPLPSALDLEEERPLFDWVGETARRVGILVHAELARMTLEDAAAVRAREDAYRRWLARCGVPGEHLERAAARVVTALLGVQSDARGRWILARRAREDHREYALSGAFEGQIERAVFDRCFVDEAGVRWVIDYKTSEHAGGGREEFLAREVERYRGQLERYARLARRLGPEPVRVALYFPLMQAWREWQPGQAP